jgi:hypothetical protein
MQENKSMKANLKRTLAVLDRGKSNGWIVCGTALVFFAAGSFLTARMMQLEQVRAD